MRIDVLERRLAAPPRPRGAALGWLRPLVRGPYVALRRVLQERQASRLCGQRGSTVVIDSAQLGARLEVPGGSNLARRLAIGAYEPGHVALFREIVEAGDDLVDVGANVGVFTVLGARLIGSGRVLAVEANPTNADLLERNIAHNAIDNVIVHRGAAAETDGELTLHSIDGAEEYSSLGEIVHPGATGTPTTVTVPTTPLDALVEAHGLTPRLLKIDVEGGEGVVLGGARATLATHRPVIVSELDARLLPQLDWTVERVLALLTDAGYRVHDIGGRTLAPDGDVADFVGDILALPVGD